MPLVAALLGLKRPPLKGPWPCTLLLASRRSAPIASPGERTTRSLAHGRQQRKDTGQCKSGASYTNIASDDFGSNASRRPSPMKFNAISVSTRIAHGNVINHQ